MKKLLKRIGIILGGFLLLCFIIGVLSPSNDSGKSETNNKLVETSIITKEPTKTTEKPKKTNNQKKIKKSNVESASISSEKPVSTIDNEISKYKSYLDNIGIDYSQYTDEEIKVCYKDVKEYIDTLNKITTYDDMLYVLEDCGFDIDNMTKYECYLAFDELITDDKSEEINMEDFTNDFDSFKNYIRENKSGNAKIKGEVGTIGTDYIYINKDNISIKIPTEELTNTIIFEGDTIIVSGTYEFKEGYVYFYNTDIIIE